MTSYCAKKKVHDSRQFAYIKRNYFIQNIRGFLLISLTVSLIFSRPESHFRLLGITGARQPSDPYYNV